MTNALHTAIRQTGSQSSAPQAPGRAHLTMPARQWGTARLSTACQTTKAHQSRFGAAERHNRTRTALPAAAAAMDSTHALHIGTVEFEALCSSQFSMTVI